MGGMCSRACQFDRSYLFKLIDHLSESALQEIDLIPCFWKKGESNGKVCNFI
jgi:hypothetical protein